MNLGLIRCLPDDAKESKPVKPLLKPLYLHFCSVGKVVCVHRWLTCFHARTIFELSDSITVSDRLTAGVVLTLRHHCYKFVCKLQILNFLTACQLLSAAVHNYTVLWRLRAKWVLLIIRLCVSIWNQFIKISLMLCLSALMEAGTSELCHKDSLVSEWLKW